jgi:hypothetical protein
VIITCPAKKSVTVTIFIRTLKLKNLMIWHSPQITDASGLTMWLCPDKSIISQNAFTSCFHLCSCDWLTTTAQLCKIPQITSQGTDENFKSQLYFLLNAITFTPFIKWKKIIKSNHPKVGAVYSMNPSYYFPSM